MRKLRQVAKLPPKERRKALEVAQQREPKNPLWAVELAREAEERADHKAAIAWADKALELAPAADEARILRARARMGRKDWKEAREDLTALGEKAYTARPALTADLFVC